MIMYCINIIITFKNIFNSCPTVFLPNNYIRYFIRISYNIGIIFIVINLCI